MSIRSNQSLSDRLELRFSFNPNPATQNIPP